MHFSSQAVISAMQDSISPTVTPGAGYQSLNFAIPSLVTPFFSLELASNGISLPSSPLQLFVSVSHDLPVAKTIVSTQSSTDLTHW